MHNTPCTYRISVKAVIRDEEGKFLLIREKDGSWELPGGGLEQGETPREGLAREISEETGLVVEGVDDQPVAFWTIQKEVGSSSLKWFAFVAYGVRVSGEFRPPPDTEEAEEAAYFSKEEVMTLKLHDNTKPYFSVA